MLLKIEPRSSGADLTTSAAVGVLLLRRMDVPVHEAKIGLTLKTDRASPLEKNIFAKMIGSGEAPYLPS
jgi:hypothetical protein